MPRAGKRLVFLTNQTTLPALTICALYGEPLASGVVLQVDQACILRIKRFYGTSENAVKTQIWIAVSVYRAGCDRQEAAGPGGVALHIAAGPLYR